MEADSNAYQEWVHLSSGTGQGYNDQSQSYNNALQAQVQDYSSSLAQGQGYSSALHAQTQGYGSQLQAQGYNNQLQHSDMDLGAASYVQKQHVPTPSSMMPFTTTRSAQSSGAQNPKFPVKRYGFFTGDNKVTPRWRAEETDSKPDAIIASVTEKFYADRKGTTESVAPPAKKRNGMGAASANMPPPPMMPCPPILPPMGMPMANNKKRLYFEESFDQDGENELFAKLMYKKMSLIKCHKRLEDLHVRVLEMVTEAMDEDWKDQKEKQKALERLLKEGPKALKAEEQAANQEEVEQVEQVVDAMGDKVEGEVEKTEEL